MELLLRQVAHHELLPETGVHTGVAPAAVSAALKYLTCAT